MEQTVDRTFYKDAALEHNPRIVESILVCIIAFSATVGEQMNVYFPFASKIYVFSGFLLLLMMCFRRLLRLQSGERILAKMPGSFWMLFFVIFLVTFARLFSSGVSIGILDLVERMKTPLFMLYGVVLCTAFLDYEKNMDMFCWSYLLGFILMIPFGRSGDFTTAYRFVGTYTNPNTYGVDCIIALFMSMYLLKDRKLWVIKTLFALAAVVCLLRTGSRGALMSVLLGIALIFMFTKDFQKKFIFITLGIAAAISIFLYSFKDTSGVFVRLFEKSYSGNVRLQVWQAYFENFSKFFFFGASESVISTIHKYTPHNSFLGVLVRYGIFALVPYIAFILYNLRYSFKKGRDRAAGYSDRVLSSLIFSLTMSGMTMENINHRATWVILALVLYNVYNYEKRPRIKFVMGRK